MSTPENQSLRKAFELIGIVCLADRAVPLKNVAAQAKIPVATTHRLLMTLRTIGAIRLAEDGSYELGRLLSDFRDNEVARAHELRQIIDDHLGALHRKVGMTLRLAVLDSSDMATFVAGVDTDEDRAFSPRIGASYEAYFTSSGKLLLSQLNDDRLWKYMSVSPLISMTKSTICSPMRLHTELQTIRQLGFAQECEEFTEGINGVSVPVVDLDGKLVAALSLTSSRVALHRITGLLPCLMESARDLSARLSAIPGGARSLLRLQ